MQYLREKGFQTMIQTSFPGSSYPYLSNIAPATQKALPQQSFFTPIPTPSINATNTTAFDQSAGATSGSISISDTLQQMVSMLSMMLQVMGAMLQSQNIPADTTSDNPGTTNTNTLNPIDNNSILQAQNSIASELASAGTDTAATNQTLVNQIAQLDPNSDQSIAAQVGLVQANPTAEPEHLQEFLVLQALRAQNTTLTNLNSKQGFSTLKAQATASQTQLINSLQTLQHRSLSQEELQALPLPASIQQILLPNTPTASQILDLNADYGRDPSFTPPGGIVFSDGQPLLSLTALQSQYLFYTGNLQLQTAVASSDPSLAA
jgi:hypothetical protein